LYAESASLPSQGAHNFCVLAVLCALAIRAFFIGSLILKSHRMKAQLEGDARASPAGRRALHLPGLARYARQLELITRNHFNAMMRMQRVVQRSRMALMRLGCHLHPESIAPTDAAGKVGVKFKYDAAGPVRVRFLWGLDARQVDRLFNSGQEDGRGPRLAGGMRESLVGMLPVLGHLPWFRTPDPIVARPLPGAHDPLLRDEHGISLVDLREEQAMMSSMLSQSSASQEHSVAPRTRRGDPCTDWFAARHFHSGGPVYGPAPGRDVVLEVDPDDFPAVAGLPFNLDGSTTQPKIPLTVIMTTEWTPPQDGERAANETTTQAELSFIRFRRSAATPSLWIPEVVKQLVVERAGQSRVVQIDGLYGFEEGDEEDLCMVCCDATKNAIVLPCLHASVCNDCLRQINNEKCPVCRGQFSAMIEIRKAGGAT